MAYVIAEPCVDVHDRGCVDECPVDCIYDGVRKGYIQPDECVDCAACEPVCPVTAIFHRGRRPIAVARLHRHRARVLRPRRHRPWRTRRRRERRLGRPWITPLSTPYRSPFRDAWVRARSLLHSEPDELAGPPRQCRAPHTAPGSCTQPGGRPRCSSPSPPGSVPVPLVIGASCHDHARGPRSLRRGRWQDRRPGPQLHAARRRQDGRGRSQRRREDQPAQGPCGGGASARGQRHAHRRVGLPPAGSTPAPRGRSHHRPGAHPGRARPDRSGPPSGEGSDPVGGVARGTQRGAVRPAGGGVPRARRLRGGVRGPHDHGRPRPGPRPSGPARSRPLRG